MIDTTLGNALFYFRLCQGVDLLFIILYQRNSES